MVCHFHVNNLFDKYALLLPDDKSWAGMARFEDKNRNLPELQRVYGHYITTPRTGAWSLPTTLNFDILRAV